MDSPDAARWSPHALGIGYRPLLAIMTRSQANDPKAANMRPLIGELTTLMVPWLVGKP